VYSELERAGLIYTRSGQGCFASDRGGDRLSEAAIIEDLGALLNNLLAQARVYQFPRSAMMQLFEDRMKEFYPEDKRKKGDATR
jgi:DNA-binding transcriptional regulator YhcF (GntR family)